MWKLYVVILNYKCLQFEAANLFNLQYRYVIRLLTYGGLKI